MEIKTSIADFTIKTGTVDDVPMILSFIKRLADYEKLSHEVMTTEKSLTDSLFGERPSAEVVIGYYQDQPVAFALFYPTYSTFLGKSGLYLEDLYVASEMRGKGFGKVLISYLAKLATTRDCGRIEWSVLDWNEPALRFYKSLGAKPMTGWIINRVEGDTLDQLAASFD